MTSDANIPELYDFGKYPSALVPLPSKGKVYKKDSLFFEKEFVSIGSMTCQDEDLLFNSTYKQNGTTVEELIKSCLTEKGIDIGSMLAGDKAAIMIAIRISGYGRNYQFTIGCPNCETENEINIDLTTLPVHRLEIEPINPGENLFKFILPKSKKQVKFMFSTVSSERNARSAQKAKVESLTKSSKLVTLRLLESIKEIDGVSTRAGIEEIVKNMYAFDSRYLREYIAEHEPGVVLKTMFDCSGCEYSENFSLPSDYEFFSINPKDREAIWLEPMFLLMYYCGISPFEYLRLPLYIRKWLIERTNKEIEAASKSGSQPASRGAHHNTPDVRALSSKTRSHVPARLRRFT